MHIMRHSTFRRREVLETHFIPTAEPNYRAVSSFTGTQQKTQCIASRATETQEASADPLLSPTKLTNDDGPPSAQSSPYILPFVGALEAAGHTVSVIIPDTQRSWIGKAHLVGQTVQTTAYWPPAATPAAHDPTSSTWASPSNTTTSSDTDRNNHNNDKDGDRRPWILANTTPASCAQLGLNGPFFAGRPIDLVIAGPNFGRNTTAVFALSSGTLGAALEACLCGRRTIALSFAFFRNRPDWDSAAAVREACAHAVRICEHLADPARPAAVAWAPGQLYSVNVPVQAGVSARRVLWTRMLGNQWTQGGCFEEVPAAAAAEEAASAPGEAHGETAAAACAKRFRWAPRFQDVYDSVRRAGPGSDGWAVQEGETSVTALMANFMPADGFQGEVKL